MSLYQAPEPLHAAPAGLGVLRDLAAGGRLADAASDPAVVPGLRAAAYDLVWPLVWARHTRRLESAKGHARCASSFGRLESACLDGFHDDVEAVVEYLFRHAHEPIRTVEGWVTSRIPAAVVDGNRRRRGRRGALQRVRVPQWLVAGLDADPWAVELAARVIEWVGVPSTAGPDVWPIDAWVDLRARVTGDRVGSHPARVAADLRRVLDTMRRRPAWYADYVERPLAAKEAPVVGTSDIAAERLPEAADDDDARLAALAAAALAAIEAGLAEGRAPGRLVPEVVAAAFGPGSVLADERAAADLVRRVLDVVERR